MNNAMPNLPCTKIKFPHLVPIFIEIQLIVLYMEYTAMKTDRHTDSLNTTHLLHILLCKGI